MGRKVGSQWLRIAMCVCWLGVWGCGEDPQQLLDTAKFEEQQGNHAHATQLYEQIIRMDPDGELAKTARERLSKLKQ